MDDNWSRIQGASQSHDRKTSMFDLFTSHNGLLVVVVISGERFLASDVTQVVNCKWWLIEEQRVVCHVSPQHSKYLWRFNRLIKHS